MKKFAALFLLVWLGLFAGCGHSETVTMVDENGDEVEVELTPGANIDSADVVVTASSTLVDNSGYGFDYAATSVLDTDYSTAWCAGNEKIPSLTLEFPETAVLGTVGIVPGFGRDEDIFFKNNRVKTLEVWYDDQTEALAELNFEDKYGMQFFQMPSDPVSKVTFKIKQTYPGSVYKDTCLAEVDFWSDWVEEQDAQAAYDFYLEEKSEDAIQPAGVEEVTLTTGNYLTSCGAVDMNKVKVSGGVYSDAETGERLYVRGYNSVWSGFTNGPVAVSIKMDEFSREGNELIVQWLLDGQMLEAHNVLVEACENGDLYAHDSFPVTAGNFDVNVYYGDNLIGDASYSVAK